MRISVAMCTWNGVAFLPQQLESLATQQRLPDELVLCDDASSDETVQLLEAFRKVAPFPVRLLRNEENLGYARNFQKAIHSCTGDVIALADQDDIWYPQKLERLEETFDASPAIEGVFSDGDLIDAHGRATGRTLWQSFLFGPAEQRRFNFGAAATVLLRRNVVTGMAFALRSTARDLLPSMPASWMHDGWLAMGIALRGSLVALPERLVAYRVHGTQQVGTPLSAAGKVKALRQDGPLLYLRLMHAKNLDEYERTALQFDDLGKFLRQQDREQPMLAAIEEKALHAHRGARALALARWRRWQILLPHARGYKSFSPNGSRGLLRDLIA